MTGDISICARNEIHLISACLVFNKFLTCTFFFLSVADEIQFAKPEKSTFFKLFYTLSTGNCFIILKIMIPELIIQFQKISIPPPWKINGNSKGEGVAKAIVFKEKYGGYCRVGGCIPKSLPWEGYEYFLEPYILIILLVPNKHILVIKICLLGTFCCDYICLDTKFGRTITKYSKKITISGK